MATNIIQNGDVSECWNKPDDISKPNHWGIYYGNQTSELIGWGSDDVDYVDLPCSAYFSFKAVNDALYAWINVGLIAANNGGYGSLDSSSVYGGQTYQISFDIKHDFVDGIGVIVNWFDDADTRNQYQVYLSSQQGKVPQTNGLWVHYSSTFIMPVGARKAVLMFRVQQSYPLGTIMSGICHVDNVFLGSDYECPISTACFTHNVSNNVAMFDASCSTGGTTSNNITHSIQSYTWKFGDLATGSGKNVSHTYSAPRTYSVELTVRNDCETVVSTTSNFVTITSTGNDGESSDNSLMYIGIAAIGVLGIYMFMSKK